MKYYMRGILTATIISTLLFTSGCRKIEPKQEQTSVESETPQTQLPKENSTSTSETKPEPKEKENTEPELANDYKYELTSNAVSEKGIYTIEFPVMSGLVGELTQDYINQALKNTAMSMLLPNVTVENPLVVTYEVKRQDEKYISILYKGLLTWENGAIEIWNPVTIDIPSSNLVLVENLVKSDLKSTTEFNQVFSDAALKIGFEFDAPQEWMGMYFTDSEIVFYFMENDYATTYSLIQIPFSQVSGYINLDFGIHPAS